MGCIITELRVTINSFRIKEFLAMHAGEISRCKILRNDITEVHRNENNPFSDLIFLVRNSTISDVQLQRLISSIKFSGYQPKIKVHKIQQAKSA